MASKWTPGPPTHNLCVKDKEDDNARWCTIGVMWWDEERKSASIKLNPCTSIGWDDRMSIVAFPKDKEEHPKTRKRPSPPMPDDFGDFAEDDVPF
jgi:hypothetical protein